MVWLLRQRPVRFHFDSTFRKPRYCECGLGKGSSRMFFLLSGFPEGLFFLENGLHLLQHSINTDCLGNRKAPEVKFPFKLLTTEEPCSVGYHGVEAALLMHTGNWFLVLTHHDRPREQLKTSRVLVKMRFYTRLTSLFTWLD